MKKKICALLFCTFLVAAQIPNVFASELEVYALPGSTEIIPLWKQIANINPSITVKDSGEAVIFCSVYGKIGITDRIELTAELQRLVSGKWVTIKTFKAESNTHRVILSQKYTITKGFSYRVKVTVKVCSGALEETDVVTSRTVAV